MRREIVETEVTILLDEFYDRDSVVIKVDDIEVYNEQEVTTKLTISLADEIKVKTTGAEITVSVEVPSRNAKKIETVKIEGETPKVTVSLNNGFIVIKSSPMAAYL